MKTTVLDDGNIPSFRRDVLKKLKLIGEVETHVCSNTPSSETQRRNKDIKVLF